MKLYVISDNTDTATGMRLVGCSGVVVHTQTEFTAALNEALADKTIGIILVTEHLANQFGEAIDDLRLKATLPLVVVIPDRHGSGRSGNFIEEYIRQAIGVKL